MNHPDEALLHSSVDEELPARERALMSEHLAECPSCRAVVSEVRALRQEAVRVFSAPGATGAPAPPHLWGRIEARIASSQTQARDRGQDTPMRARRPRFGPPGRMLMRAAVVVLLVGISSSLTYLLVRSDAERGEPPQPSVGAVPVATGGEVTGGGAAAIAAAYEPALADMEQLLEEGRGRLRPETIAALEENLRIIDAAIGEVQEALAADPAHPSALRSLDGVYQAKLKLLRQAVVLTSGV